MNRVRNHQSFLLGGILALAGCGGHLEAVQVTGDVGARLSGHETALGSLSATCLEVATLSGSNEECADLRARARSWGRAVALVDAYARGLRAAAMSRGEGPLLGSVAVDTAGDAWPGLSPAQTQAVKTLSSAVQTMLVRAQSESDLRSVIAGSDAAVQEIARGIDEVVGHELGRIDLARTSIDVVRDRLQQLATTAPPAPRPGASARAPSAPAADAHPAEKTAALVAAQLATELAPLHEAMATLRDRLDETLTERTMDRQVAVPGALAELGLMQNDLESKRARLERLRDAADAFARAHKALRDSLERLEPDAILTEVVRAASQQPPPAPSAMPASQ
jgi:hypothetical protein